MSKIIKNAKKIQGKSRTHEVSHLSGNTFEVISGASGKTYTVTTIPGGARCTCNWGKYRKGWGQSGCSHVVSVYDWLESQRGRSVSAWASRDDAKRQHRPSMGIGDGVVLTSRIAVAA